MRGYTEPSIRTVSQERGAINVKNFVRANLKLHDECAFRGGQACTLQLADQDNQACKCAAQGRKVDRLRRIGRRASELQAARDRV